MLGGVTWKMVYMVTVSGRFPEYSEILNMSIPHLFTSSISCGCTTRADFITTCCGSRHWDNGHAQKKQTNKQPRTLARSPSWLALTPKRGMVEGARLGLWVAFFTPLIWDMGRFFLSFSLAGGDMMSMSCCFSVRSEWTERHGCALHVATCCKNPVMCNSFLSLLNIHLHISKFMQIFHK